MSQRYLPARAPEEASMTFERIAQVLASWCPASADKIVTTMARSLSTWAKEKNRKAVVTTLSVLRGWSRYWPRWGQRKSAVRTWL